MNEQKRDQALALALGLFLFAVYLLSYRGGFHSVDEVSTFAVTENLVKFGALNTDQIAWTQWVTTQAEAQGFFGHDGHVYSKKGFAISLAQAPLYWLALVTPGLGLLQTVSLLNAILAAGTGVIIYMLLRRMEIVTAAALWVALLFGLGTLSWVYAKYLFSGTLAGFLLILSLYHLLAYRQDRSVWHLALAGFAGGLTVLTRANNLILLIFFGLYLVYILIRANGQARKTPNNAWDAFIFPLLVFGGSAALAGAILLWYNWVRAGDPFQTGYDLTIFSPNVLVGLYKLLFSPLRGLFIYSPLLILALPGWVKLQKQFRAEAWLIFAVIGSTILLFSAWSSGEGLSWGSRFLVPIVPFFIVALAPIIADFSKWTFWQRGLIILLSGLSFVIQLIGVVINPWVYLNELQSKFGGEFFLERTTALTDYSTSQIIGQLRYWSAANSDLIWWQPTGFDYIAFGMSAGLICLAGGFLYWLAKQPGTSWPILKLAGGLGLATLVMTVFLLTRYYDADPQFGSPDNTYLQALNQAVEISDGRDQIVTVAQYNYHVPMNYFKARVPLFGFAQNEAPLPDTADRLLNEILMQGDKRVWLVTVGRQPAEQTNRVEAWLSAQAYKNRDQWLGETRLIDYGLPQPAKLTMLDIIFDLSMVLLSQERPESVQAGQILPITFSWQAIKPVEVNYTVFIQLIDITGALVTQHDGLPQGGYLPTTRWSPETVIVDRHGLAIPDNLAAGDYRLIAGLYDPSSGQRLPTNAGSDFAELGIVTVKP